MPLALVESWRNTGIAILATAMIALHLVLRYAFHGDDSSEAWLWQNLPLFATLAFGGAPLSRRPCSMVRSLEDSLVH